METATWLHLQDSYLYATRRELLKLSFYSVLFLPSKKFKVFSHEGIWGSHWIPLGEEIREIWLGTHISFTEIGRWDWIRLLGLHGPPQGSVLFSIIRQETYNGKFSLFPKYCPPRSKYWPGSPTTASTKQWPGWTPHPTSPPYLPFRKPGLCLLDRYVVSRYQLNWTCLPIP